VSGWLRLGLRGRVALTLAAGFAVVTALFLLVLLPLQRDQRARLLEQDVRLLATIKDKHQRDLIHDLLSENPDALSIDMADLVRQPRMLWARVDAGELSVSATADKSVMEALLGRDAVPASLPSDAVLLLWGDGRTDILDASGRSLPGGRRSAHAGALPPQGGARHEVLDWQGRPALRYGSELRAADTVFGQLELIASLAELQRSEQLTRRAVLGIVLASFVVLVLALDLLLSRIVLEPVREVARAMGAASAGNLASRLDIRSTDEIGAMAASFNAMVADLESSKREVEDASRNLESMVVERTRELQASERRSRELRLRLEAVLAQVATGILALDAEGRVTSMNERAAEVLGTPVERVRGVLLGEALGADHPLVHEVQSVLATGAGRRTGHLTLRTEGGARRLSTVVSALPGGGGAVLALEDLTQLIATQRLEAWKEAVERVIHEIKNPLTPVGLSAQALRTAWGEDRVRFDAMFPAACDLILRSVQDLRALIAEFTRFSRLPAPVPHPHDLNALVEEVVAPYAATPPPGVEVRTELAEGLPPADIDREQVGRVLLNVVNNGLEAMESRPGTLLVRTFQGARNQVGVEVCDDGCGIDDVDRIFEPYYTTKAKGTGLGLVISRQVIEEHGGRIEVRSRPGEGTQLRLVLPAAARDGGAEGGSHGGTTGQGDAGQRAGVVRTS
jgi:nitrogen-specific signal transduction histidine kinase/HAMP domain-containing protein